jgi:hypothetical protein
VNDVTTDALQQMARHVAEQLVADALKHMVTAPVTITPHPQPTRRLIEPGGAPSASPTTVRRGRKPGPKPGKSKRWTPAQRAKFAASMAARRQQKASPAAAASPATRKPGRPRKAAGRCTRCDHTEGEHDATTGKCLSVRCVCAEFCD